MGALFGRGKMKIKDEVNGIILENAICDLGDIRPYTNLITDLGINPPNMTRLYMALEDKFNIAIAFEAGRPRTVDGIYDYIKYCGNQKE